MEENPEDGINKPVKIQSFSENQEKGKQCEICMKEVENEKELKRHKKLVHDPTSDKHFECQKCSKSCSTFESLIEHHIGAGKSGNEHCGICHKEFEYEIGLREHEEDHRDTKDKNYRCVTCEVKFPQLKQIILHSLIHNTPAVIKGISIYESDIFRSMMELSKNAKMEEDNNGKSPAISTHKSNILHSVMELSKNKEMKESDNEKFSASLNTETNEKEVSPVIKNDNEQFSTSMKIEVNKKRSIQMVK